MKVGSKYGCSESTCITQVSKLVDFKAYITGGSIYGLEQYKVIVNSDMQISILHVMQMWNTKLVQLLECCANQLGLIAMKL